MPSTDGEVEERNRCIASPRARPALVRQLSALTPDQSGDMVDKLLSASYLRTNLRFFKIDKIRVVTLLTSFEEIVVYLCDLLTRSQCGRSMRESHEQLLITGTEWEAFLDDVQQTVDKFGVPPAEQAELKAIVASTRADIVVGE